MRESSNWLSTLVATDRLRRDLVANIGHDLRTPLSGLLGHLEESRRALEAGDTESSRSSLESARSQITFVTRLVEDLFELSLLDSEEPPLRLEPVPLGELIQQAADGHRGLFRADGKDFHVAIQTGMPVVRADGTRLLRLVQNLPDNARKHTPASGHVALAAEADRDWAEVRVSDDGPGIRPEELDHLFQRFYQSDSPRTRQGDGTGLGLAISRAIAEAHGGSLAVISETGEGTTFIFRLPVRVSSEDGSSAIVP